MMQRAQLEARTGLGPREAGPGCPHCRIGWSCEECRRQFHEIRQLLGSRMGDEVSNIDLYRMLQAVRDVDLDCLSLRQGDWAPAERMLRKAFWWLSAERDDLLSLPKSKRPAHFRPLTRWEGKVVMADREDDAATWIHFSETARLG